MYFPSAFAATQTMLENSVTQPKFLDFGVEYPRELFTAIVVGRDRVAFGNLGDLRGRPACVTETMELYRKKPEVILP